MNSFEFLEKLGFSSNEAKVYGTLIKHKVLNGYEIAKLSGVARSLVYEVINRLVAKGGAMSIPWTQKVELFSQHSICRENYFLCCQSLIFNLLWCLVIKSTMAPFSVVE